MNKMILTISILAMMVVSACTGQSPAPTQNEGQPAQCNYETQEKSYVGKSADECSRIKFMCIQGTEYFADECGCGCQPIVQEANEGKDVFYMSIPREECSLALIQCEAGMEGFVDDVGCGCRKPSLVQPSQEGKLKATDCTPEQKQAEICTMEYLPVCGWFDSAKIQCIKYPCAQTFGNICQACAAENVVSWTPGECPQ